MHPVDGKQLWTEKEVERDFSIPRRTLQKWRFLGSGPTYVKIGRSIRYRLKDIEAFIDSRTVGPEGDRHGGE